MVIHVGPGADAIVDEQTPLPVVRSANIRSLPVRLPEKGHIKIGGLGQTKKSARGNEYQLPVKFNHFRLTTLQRGDDGNFIVDKALHEKLNLGEFPTEIPIRLLFDDIDLNLQSRLACYAGKTLWCHGDGVVAERLDVPFEKAAEGKERQSVQCPCHRQNIDYQGRDRCKMNGRLSTMIDGAGGVGGIWVLRTTSYNTITGIKSSLELLQTITGGLLANLPLKLSIQPKLVTSPVTQKPVTIYIVVIEFNGDNIAELQQEAHKLALARATTLVSIKNIEEQARRRLSLPPPPNAVFDGEGEDAEDITAEFYTDVDEDEAAVDTGEPPPPRPTRGARQAPQAPEPSTEPEPEPERTYAIINEDGVVFEDIPAGELVDRLIAVFGDAAKVGLDQWRGVGESNADLINALKAGDKAEQEMAEAIRKAYLDAAPEEARQPPEKRQRRRKATEPDKGRDPDNVRDPGIERDPKEGREPDTSRDPSDAREPVARREPNLPREPAEPREPVTPRDPIWETDNWTIPTTTKSNNMIDFGALQRTLMDTAKQARSAEELKQFVVDNTVNLRRLHDYSTGVEMTVQELFAALAKGFEEQRQRGG